jgi:5,10-methylenetetrahydromethanopterin reductase
VSDDEEPQAAGRSKPTARGVVVPPALPTDELFTFISEAERLGFDEVWVVEDCFFRGGVAQAAVALAVTSRIRVGIGILPAGARNAAFLSLDIATLADLFPGRLIVGVGHGMSAWMNQVDAWPASPITMLGEYIMTLKAILGGGLVTRLEQRYVRVENVQLHRAPSVPPPIFAGVRGPKSLEACADIADGTILAEPVTPEYLAFAREHLTGASAAHVIVAYNVAAVDEDQAHARDIARASLKWFGEPAWRPHIAALPFADELYRLRLEAGSPERFAAELPDEWVDQLALVGTPHQVRSRMNKLAAAGADHLVLVPAGDPLRMLPNLARALA